MPSKRRGGRTFPTPEPEPCVVVLFGASGDLVQRKIVPALAQLDAQGRLPDRLCVLGVSRTPFSDDEFRDKLAPAVLGLESDGVADRWPEFKQRLHYLAADATKADAYAPLRERIVELCDLHRARGDLPEPDAVDTRSDRVKDAARLPNLLLYLSVAPNLVEPIVEQLGASNLVLRDPDALGRLAADMPWQRIVVEKPIGHDLDSAKSLNAALARVFSEEQIYRIDHYLGKELVQNILVMRFANALFEPVWSNHYVDHVQVTAAEAVGVGRRAGGFYDNAGATRDMIQSHLLQLTALVAMEPPSSFTADAIRREKVKFMEAVRPIAPPTRGGVNEFALGRYGPSTDPNDDDAGAAYADLDGVDPLRNTETFAAIKLHCDNWRWTGVPFYIRSGKKLARKLTEVVIQLKHPPANLFRHVEPFASGGVRPPNRIIINIAPAEGVSLRFEAKVPGASLRIGSVHADFDYKDVFDAQPMEAYGPLLLEAMRGDRTLFKHRDEVETAWRVVAPVLNMPGDARIPQTYTPGSWGPASADMMMRADNRAWHNPGEGDPKDV